MFKFRLRSPSAARPRVTPSSAEAVEAPVNIDLPHGIKHLHVGKLMNHQRITIFANVSLDPNFR